MNEAIESQHARKIQDALLVLMETMGYHSIRVQHIARQAGISRNTFYRCFKNKDQVVLAIYDEAMSGFLEYTSQEIELAVASKGSREDVVYDVVLRIFTGVYENMHSTRLLFSADIDELIYSRFSLFFTRLCGQMIRIRHLNIKEDRLIQFLLSHLAGSAFHFMKAWILDPNPPEPEQMARLYTRILKPSLELISEQSEVG